MVCCGSRYRNFNSESKGYILDLSLSGFGAGIAVYVMLGSLQIAKKVSDEDGFIEGTSVKPESILVLSHTISAVGVALFMPVVGAIIDYTSRRWHVCVVSRVVAFIELVVVILFLDEESFFWPIVFLGVVGSMASSSNSTARLAYVPELTHSRKERTSINTRAATSWSLCSVLSMIFPVVLGQIFTVENSNKAMGIGCSDVNITKLVYNNTEVMNVTSLEEVCEDTVKMGDDPIHLARLACMWVIGITTFPVAYVWLTKMKKRPAVRQLEKGNSLVIAGFRSIRETWKDLRSSSVTTTWYLFAVALNKAGASSFILVAIPYYSQVLKMSQMDYLACFLAMYLISAPACMLVGHFITKPLGESKSFTLSLLFWLTTMGSFCIFVATPEDAWMAWIYIFPIALSLGWFYPVGKDAYYRLIPGGKEAEMMGVWTFSDALLSWVPSLIDTALINAGVEERYLLTVTAGFTFLGLVVMVFLVNPTYEETCDKVNKTKGKRFMATQNQARASQRRSSAFYVPTLEINELVSDTDYDEDNSSGGEGKTSAKVFVEA